MRDLLRTVMFAVVIGMLLVVMTSNLLSEAVETTSANSTADKRSEDADSSAAVTLQTVDSTTPRDSTDDSSAEPLMYSDNTIPTSTREERNGEPETSMERGLSDVDVTPESNTITDIPRNGEEAFETSEYVQRKNRQYLHSHRRLAHKCSLRKNMKTRKCRHFFKRMKNAEVQGKRTCGKGLNNTETEVCCGGVAYNRTEELHYIVCCNDTLVQQSDFKGKNNMYGKCCDGRIIDLRCFTCWENGIVRKKSNDKECSEQIEVQDTEEKHTHLRHVKKRIMKSKKCSERKFSKSVECRKFFNRQSSMPSRKSPAALTQRAGERIAKCLTRDGHILYFKVSSEVCCAGAVHPKKEDRYVKGCCNGSHLYNVDVDVCCDGHLIPKSAFNGSSKPFCCNNQLQNAEERCYTCINNTARFDPQDSYCCKDVQQVESDIIDTRCTNGTLRPVKLYNDKENIEDLFDEIKARDNDTLNDAEQEVAKGQGAHEGNTVVVYLVALVVVGVVGVCVVGVLRNNKDSSKPSTHIADMSQNYEINEQPTAPHVCNRNNSQESYENNDGLTSLTLMKIVNEDSLQKASKIKQENVFENQFLDSATQTYGAKPNNKRTVFGLPFEYSDILNASKRTLEMPNTRVRMILPESLFEKHRLVEAHASAPHSIPAIMRKFKFEKDEWIASPTMEYFLTGDLVFLDHAVIIMPFTGSPDDLKVWKFTSDEGAYETGRRTQVPRSEDYTCQLEYFYTYTKGDDFIRIYTRGFSGYFCSQCGKRDLSLQAKVYASFTRTKRDEAEISLAVYLVERTVGQFPQYLSTMGSKEEEQGRKLKQERRVELIGDDVDPLTDNDFLKLTVDVVDDDLKFEHKKTRNGNFVYQPVVNKEMKEVVRCPHHCDVPYVVDWCLVIKEHTLPRNINVRIEITSYKRSDPGCLYGTERNIDVKLQRQDEDIQQGQLNRENEDLKKYIEELAPSEQERLYQSLSEDYTYTDKPAGLPELLNNMERLNSPLSFQTVIARALRDCQLASHITRLDKMKILLPNAIPKPTQEGEQNQGACGFSGRENLCTACGRGAADQCQCRAELSKSGVFSFTDRQTSGQGDENAQQS